MLNFHMELTALIIGILLCIACTGERKCIDLKGKIYVNLVQITTIALAGNIGAYFIIHNNILSMIAFAEILVCVSFILMIWFCMHLNLYLLETIHRKNHIDYGTYIAMSLPLCVEVIIIIMNYSNHNLFEILQIDNKIEIVFNSWYPMLYILMVCSLIIYIANLVKYRNILREKRQYVLFGIPVILLICYNLQYHYKNIAILGFCYSMTLLLLFIYSYHHNVKRDGLTRLPDGIAFKQMLDFRIGQKQPMTIAMITLDDFKQVNREYGYYNGNQYLKLIATFLKEKSPKQCITRYSGDKFAIVFDEKNSQDIKQWCDSILERFQQPWELGKLRHKLSVCISIVEYPNMAESSVEILDLLEFINTYGKQNKRNQYVICNDEFKNAMKRRIRIASLLNEIVRDGAMEVEYQPILDVSENVYNRAEASFKLEDEELGTVSPAEYFSIAEENGYIIDLGYILLDNACQYIRKLQELGENVPIISMNFFRQQIVAEDVEQRIVAILDKHKVSPEQLAFELPESVFALQYDEIKEQMTKLHNMGCRFYLDGFGKAFLDLPQLMDLPFEVIKINKTMLHEADQNDAFYLLVSAMIAIFEENGKLILGDGIESQHLKEMADLLFMDYLQGHYICAPMKEEEAGEEFKRTQIIEGVPSMEELLAEMNIGVDS